MFRSVYHSSSRYIITNEKKVIEIVSSLIILLFSYAAISKLFDYGEFKTQLSKSPFISSIAGFIAWSLPVGELLIVLCLLFNRTRLIGLYGSFFLMSVFTVYVYMMLHYSYYLPCSCGGILSKMDWHTHFWFNLFFLTLSGFGLFVKVKADQK